MNQSAIPVSSHGKPDAEAACGLFESASNPGRPDWSTAICSGEGAATSCGSTGKTMRSNGKTQRLYAAPAPSQRATGRRSSITSAISKLVAISVSTIQTLMISAP